MSLHHSGAKEILSFYELERRNAFDQNKALLAVRLEAMEREIQQLTAGYQPKESKMYNRITSQRIEVSTEEYGKQRNWQDVKKSSPARLKDALAKLPQGKRPSASIKGRKNGSSSAINTMGRSKVLPRSKASNRLGNRRTLKKSSSVPVTKPLVPLSPITSKSRHDSSLNLPRRMELRRGQLKVRQHEKARRTQMGGTGPRFPRPSFSGVMNGPNERTYNVKGFFGLHPKGELVETFAWDEVRDADIITGGAWNLRMLRYANERKASLAARAAAQKVKQSRRLKQQAKDELKVADQTDRWQSFRPRNWFVRSLEAPETMVFQYTKGGQISCSVPAPESMPKPKERNIKFHN